MSIVDVPNIPDERRLDAVRRLCEIEDPYRADEASDALFVSAMKQNIEWHVERSPFYRRFLAQAGFSAAELSTPADCERIPSLPAVFFKSHEIVSISRDQVELHLTSSGTTGQKSQMFFDGWSIRAPQRMVEFIFQKNGWISREPANYLLYTYETEPDSKLGTAYTDNFLCSFAPVKSAFYALRRTGNGSHEFDVFGAIETLRRFEKEGAPVRIFGFPAFLHFTIERMKALRMPSLRLHPQSLVFLGGGWKGHADQAIRSSDLYRSVTSQLGIPDHRIRDGFGSVEHCIPYVECLHHRFHVPVWSKVYIRDVKTLEALPSGQPGFLQFVSPYITSAPAQSVMMGDLAEWHPGDRCSCEIKTPYFVVLGRAGVSKNKSCAISAAELLRGKP